MKSRILMGCIAIVLMMGMNVRAQECTACAAASEVTTCAPCAGQPCELLGGLRNLMACRPCVSCSTCEIAAPACAPCAAPVCAPCAAPICAPCAAPVCDTCAPCETCVPCCAPCVPCVPCVIPRMKAALCCAGAKIACVGNGARAAVSNTFGALADLTAPRCCPACGACGCDGTCITCEAADCGCSAEPAVAPACSAVHPLPASPNVAE